MPHDPKAIANAFLNRAKEEGAELRPLQMQKLVYYAAGYHIAAYGKSLLNCSIEAWDYGPVIPELYREFREFGSQPITRLATANDFDSTPVAIPTSDHNAMKIIEFVWNTYKNYTGLQLSDMTHAEGTPWSKVREERPGVKNADIDEEKLRDYFSGFVKKKAA
jgi:uncharacterized phage-associated protein